MIGSLQSTNRLLKLAYLVLRLKQSPFKDREISRNKRVIKSFKCIEIKQLKKTANTSGEGYRFKFLEYFSKESPKQDKCLQNLNEQDTIKNDKLLQSIEEFKNKIQDNNQSLLFRQQREYSSLPQNRNNQSYSVSKDRKNSQQQDGIQKQIFPQNQPLQQISPKRSQSQSSLKLPRSSSNQRSNLIDDGKKNISIIPVTNQIDKIIPKEMKIKYFAMQCQNKIKFRSKAGELKTKQQKTNQDAFFIAENFCSSKNCFLFMVLDGHGDNGHFVSNYVCIQFSQLIYQVQNVLYQLLESYFKPIIYQKQKIDNQNIARGFYNAFSEAEIQLSQSGIEISMSGTTAVVILLIEKDLWCANLGDSRAILLNQQAQIQSIFELSQDHKPENPIEYQRIKQNGGRVSPLKNQQGYSDGPHRVWANSQYPGLAMSRSLGDALAHQVGVISIPEIVGHTIGSDDYFIIMGSDGLWDQIEKTVMSQIVFQMYRDGADLTAIAEFLVKDLFINQNYIQIMKSNQEWQKQNDTIDDITCLIIQLRD